MTCTICTEPITLVPSAAERAAKHGGSPGDYTKLFTEHGKCLVDNRNRDTLALMKRIREANTGAVLLKVTPNHPLR